MRLKLLCLFGFICCWLVDCRADSSPRMFVDVTINKKPAHFILDTGADGIYLFQASAKRFNLNLREVPNRLRGTNSIGKYFAETTEKCEVTYFDTTTKVRVGVIDGKGFEAEKVDGLFGWPLMRPFIFALDVTGPTGTVHFLKSLPKETKDWLRVGLVRKRNQLFLDLPEGNHTIPVVLDTGDGDGVCLSPARWEYWKHANRQSPLTITVRHSITVPLPIAVEESRAANFSLGALSFSDVPVLEDTYPGVEPYEAIIGMSAMARMDIIVDGKHSCAYFHPRNTPAPHYPYNRAGVVFLPRSLEELDCLAHVIPGSPADQADVRNGDIIMKYDDKWRTSWGRGEHPNTVFCERPAGTRMDLVLKRGDQVVNTTITLRDILTTK